MMKKYLWILLSLFVVTGCESLEDTYSDYAGDGAIRYLGKCTDVNVTPGWKKLNVTWKNGVDPLIDKIKVIWKLNDETREILLDRGVTTYSIPDLKDGSYEIIVCSVDKAQNYVLSIPAFGRPYTPEHEAVISFSRLITKHYFVKNRLVLFFSSWSEDVISAGLNYYTAGGVLKTLPLTPEILAQKYYLLEDEIDPGKPVTLDRKGHLSGSSDEVVFEPYALAHDKGYTVDFRFWMRMKYGQSDIIEDSFVESLEELELDYSISSFEDILNFPNLKKLILGKNRFLKKEYLLDNMSASVLHEMEVSRFALNVAHELCGLQVERYNDHYMPGETLPYMTNKENLDAPEKNYLDASTWQITCSPQDVQPFDSYLDNLFDGDLSNFWQPEMKTTARSHEILVDMKKMIPVNGLRVVQKTFLPNDISGKSLMASDIKIQVSADGYLWKNACWVEENTLGDTNGETTMITFSTSQEVRYVKLAVNDRAYGSNFSVALAEIGIF